MKQTYRNREQGPMYSTRNYTQYLMIKTKLKRIWKRTCALYIYIYIYIKLNHFAVQQKLT